MGKTEYLDPRAPIDISELPSGTWINDREDEEEEVKKDEFGSKQGDAEEDERTASRKRKKRNT